MRLAANPTPSQKSAPARVVTLIAGGDVLLDRGVARQIDKYHSVDWPFFGVRSLLQRADIAFANLECPLSSRGTQILKRVSFRADAKTVWGLRRAGFDRFNLANNHSFDCGSIGLLDTMRFLREAGLDWCGAGLDATQAHAARFQTVGGIRFAWLGFCEWAPQQTADNKSAAIAVIEGQTMRAAIADARARADIVIVAFHWGIEYSSRPTQRQIAWAREVASCGADLVLGAHPHVVQGFEIVPLAPHHRRTLIAYSLGNLVFDAPRAFDRRGRETVLLRCAFTRAGIQSAQLIPLVMQNARPLPGPRSDGARILADVARLSKERGTIVSDGRIEIGAPR